MAARRDLVLEVDTTLDGSGTYTSAWLDSSDIFDVRALIFFSGSPAPTSALEESNDQTNSYSGNTLTSGTSAPVTGRYFRLHVTGGGAGATYRAVVRTID